jgi:hypothetical protein
MPSFTYTVSTEFLARMRAVVLAERPELAGQTTTQINDAVKARVRQLAVIWVNNGENIAAAKAGQATVLMPTEADIT